MKTPNEIIEILSQFSGTENYYQHQFGIYYTDGIMEMATICQAFWLVDVVASYQFEPKISEEHFQVFGLKVNEDKSAIVEISDGNDNILMTQNRLTLIHRFCKDLRKCSFRLFHQQPQ